MAEASIHVLHWGIAEAGKVALIDGDHVEALRHFREALRLAASSKAPEVFFRHYTQCVLETLELAGDYGEIVDLCTGQDAFYQEMGDTGPLLAKDHGSIIERLAVAELLSGNREEAVACFKRAIARAGPSVLPLSETLLGWLRRGLVVPLGQLRQAQRRHRYFVVRRETVDRSCARKLPPAPRNQMFAA